MRCVSLIPVAAATLFLFTASARPLAAAIDKGIAATDELRPHLVGEADDPAWAARAAPAPRHDHGTKVATVPA